MENGMTALVEKKWHSCPECGSGIECHILDSGEAALVFPSRCRTRQDCLDRHALLFGLNFTRPSPHPKTDGGRE